MSIVGFNFTKINAEKKEGAKGKINIKNNVIIKDVVEQSMSLGAKDTKAMRVDFQFVSEYQPSLGNITIDSSIVALRPASEIAQIIKDWNETKQLPAELIEQLFSYVLRRCNIKAIMLAEDLNLPSPVPLPRVETKAQTEEPEKKEE
ncbi:hypothetical protein GF371_01325 [Candidatus Woesearchaeota archaeon]|nr:hypothetical protein [Candidatus Woesearchaeota archaeon]